MSFFKNIYSKYLSINLSDYENIKINLDINIVVLSLTLILCASCFILYHKQALTTTILKRMIRQDVFGLDNAASLCSLGLTDKSFRKALTTRYGYMKQAIVIDGERNEAQSQGKQIKESSDNDEGEAEQGSEYISKTSDSNDAMPDIYGRDGLISKDARIYIPSDRKDLAAHILETHSTSIMKTVFSCALILTVGLTLFFTMPYILSAINTALSK